MDLHTGACGRYNWLASEELKLADLMQLCPETVHGNT